MQHMFFTRSKHCDFCSIIYLSHIKDFHDELQSMGGVMLRDK